MLMHATFRGWLAEKLRSYSDLLRVREAVARGRRSIQARRVIHDGAVVGNFVAEIEHPYVGAAGPILNRLVVWIFCSVKGFDLRRGLRHVEMPPYLCSTTRASSCRLRSLASVEVS